MTLYEYEHNALTDEWEPLDKATWLSWSGRRRLNGRDYHGPIFYLGSKNRVERQARVCPCDVCQQTNPWKVDALAYREQVARLTRERNAALEALRDVAALRENDFGTYRSGTPEMGRRIGWEDSARIARRTIQAIETGAIHNDR